MKRGGRNNKKPSKNSPMRQWKNQPIRKKVGGGSPVHEKRRRKKRRIGMM